jgi:hypothetical protein
MKGDFIPSAQADLDTWEVNFKEKVLTVTQELKLDDADTAATLGKLDAHRATYAGMVGKQSAAKAATSTNNDAEKEAVTGYRELVGRIKKAKGYTEAMGNELKIIGSDSVFDKSAAKPVLLVSKEGSGVVIKFKKNKTSGVHIYSRRGDEKIFSFLAVDTASPYNDTRPNLASGQGETREYKAWHFLDDTIIGQESDVVSISV